VPFNLGGGRFGVNFKGRDYDGTSVTSRIDGIYHADTQMMVLDFQIIDRDGMHKIIRFDRCQGAWKNELFRDPSGVGA